MDNGDYALFDSTDWSRKEAFQFYKDFDDPYFNISLNLNVGPLLQFAKAQHVSFFLLCLYETLKSANAIENFRLRWHGEELKLYKNIEGGSTVLYDDGSFGFAYYPYSENRDTFIENAESIVEEVRANKSFDPSNQKDDLIYYSSIPWISFTGFKHAQDKRINSSIPRLTFGKYFTQSDQILMPLHIEVNHALMDGYHLGQFVERLNSQINQYEG